MKEESHHLERLVNACSEVAKYKPFCKYTGIGGMKTYEWDKRTPDKRYRELILEGKEDLTRLNNID